MGSLAKAQRRRFGLVQPVRPGVDFLDRVFRGNVHNVGGGHAGDGRRRELQRAAGTADVLEYSGGDQGRHDGRAGSVEAGEIVTSELLSAVHTPSSAA